MIITGKIKTLSPLSHNSDESLGVDTKFRRMSIIYDGKVLKIPVYSGNAFRGILRRLAASQFCTTIGLTDISDKLYYTLFCGGGLQKNAKQDYIEIGDIRKLREKIPFLSIFGTAFQNRIIQGKLNVGMLIPVCIETFDITGIKQDISVWELTEEIFYTRRDDREDKEESRGKENKQATQMKYSVECIIPGTILYQKIVLDSNCLIEKSCFYNALNSLSQKGKIGGKSGVGHGKVRFDYSDDLSNDCEYISYLEENKKEILEYCREIEQSI